MNSTLDMIFRCAAHQDVDAPPFVWTPASPEHEQREREDDVWTRQHQAQQQSLPEEVAV